MKILITGATGFLGKHLLEIIHSPFKKDTIIGVSSKEYNLLDPYQTEKMFKKINPHVVVHLAAYSGGIGANRNFPADFYFKNTLLATYTFEFAARYKVEKMLYTMGGCSYPATSISPIDESQMWNGYSQEESAGYSMAKKMGIVASRGYRKQYGLNSIVLIPGNMYGEYDNFRESESHVIPAMIRRFYEAKINNSPRITLWGSGNPTRDFVYAGDVAKCLVYFTGQYDSSEPVNISTGTTASIKQLAYTIKELVGYEGNIMWDISKPDGQMNKIFDIKKLHSLGLSCNTSLKEGLQKTIHWFEENYPLKTNFIRL